VLVQVLLLPLVLVLVRLLLLLLLRRLPLPSQRALGPTTGVRRAGRMLKLELARVMQLRSLRATPSALGVAATRGASTHDCCDPARCVARSRRHTHTHTRDKTHARDTYCRT